MKSKLASWYVIEFEKLDFHLYMVYQLKFVKRSRFL